MPTLGCTRGPTAYRLAAAVLLCALTGPASAAGWGRDYFPNVELTTHRGETVRFFDDLVENKLVAINFIFTSCVDVCPMETAQLVQVADILGDRMGKEVFFYSISIDPERDTPEVLAEYAARFGASWTFLTGKRSDIDLLRKKLGLYLDSIETDSLNHNVSMIIGNQATGQWRKSSPFENPYFLAEKIGSWLGGWKHAPAGDDYSEAPQLRRLSSGEQLFRSRCAVCHTVGDPAASSRLGPDLAGVVQRRDRRWLIEWLRAPDAMLAKQDPLAVALVEEYDGIVMPNLRLNQVDVMAVISYLQEAGTLPDTGRQYTDARPQGAAHKPATSHEHTVATTTAVQAGDVAEPLVVSGARVLVSQRSVERRRADAADADALTAVAYLNLRNTGREPVTLIGLSSRSFRFAEVHEMTLNNGVPGMRRATPLTVSAGNSLSLEPGGLHIMLGKVTEPVRVGDTVEIDLSFASGRRQTVGFIVGSYASMLPSATTAGTADGTHMH